LSKSCASSSKLSLTINLVLHSRDFLEVDALIQILGELDVVAEVAALVDNLRAEEVSQLQNVVDVVEGLDVGWLIHHPHVVEDVVLPGHELQEYYADWPQIGLVVLVLVVHDGL
jgi:hypothetical protein